MNKKEVEAFAKEAAKNLETEKDLSNFNQMLKCRKVNHFFGSFVIGEQLAFLNRFADHAVQRFNGIGGDLPPKLPP